MRAAPLAREGDLVLTPSGRMAIVLREIADGRLMLRYARGMDGEVTLPAALVTVTARGAVGRNTRISDKPA